MPRKDKYHDNVRNALIKDGWIITHDQYLLSVGGHAMYVDLGAETPLAAERDGRKIAVEIKGFLAPSAMHDFHEAVGQYRNYLFALRRDEPDRALYLAVGTDTYDELLRVADFQEMLQFNEMRLVVVDFDIEEITQWIE